MQKASCMFDQDYKLGLIIHMHAYMHIHTQVHIYMCMYVSIFYICFFYIKENNQRYDSQA